MTLNLLIPDRYIKCSLETAGEFNNVVPSSDDITNTQDYELSGSKHYLNLTQVRGFKPGLSLWIFQGEKILSTPSFGGEVKTSVPCRRFTACKRFLNATWKSDISGKIHRPFLAHIVPLLATRISGETTSGESWNV